MNTTTTETTFSKWNGTHCGNYCDLPTIDVPIVQEAPRCEGCAGELVQTGLQYNTFPVYAHVDPAADNGHWIRRMPVCSYCGSSEAITHRQEAWFDATDCGRCGATHGYAIGD
jgi:ribosomal protein S27AE